MNCLKNMIYVVKCILSLERNLRRSDKMSVLINFKICDNAKECGGIEVCPTGALTWDGENKTIKIDDSKCTSCGVCEKACPIGAIMIARTEEEYEKIKKEIDEDPRKISDLFVDRYGAQPIHEAFLISQDKFESQIPESTRFTVVELFKEDLIECLIRSIPIKELFEGMDIIYKKIEIRDNSLLEKYNVKELPSLLFFKDGNLIGKIEGYYSDKKKKELKEKINEITSQ